MFGGRVVTCFVRILVSVSVGVSGVVSELYCVWSRSITAIAYRVQFPAFCPVVCCFLSEASSVVLSVAPSVREEIVLGFGFGSPGKK